MGEISDMIMEGILCEVCGGIAITAEEEVPGYPQSCDACEGE